MLELGTVYFDVICVDAEGKKRWSRQLDFLHKPTAGDRLLIEHHPTELVEVLEVTLFTRSVRVSSFIKPKSLKGKDAIAGLLIVRESRLYSYAIADPFS
jgi:hypothetical protein